MNTKKLKLTQWFPNSIKPVRKGAYEIRDATMSDPYNKVYRYWNGRRWGFAEYSPSRCKPGNIWNHGESMTGWRGIEK